ncbi:hypothetical protein CC85DRAFT_286400 [Cutaneotrichosporon oleaginosum]|uniref:Uncharacterized protein n=1 Tax=Cutaneotrichosporon oleaginosum TaxID=879819 RepID=A0A0J0XK73_9TREE|nr:uncharacterized protein CC85DRAFT_286400 [Cutaneotrichosporon oleaginosum]KLT41491.1 hypothetical protein CC85DRAFT_286400 [Cutaneotrichosporon oleaginosum]TXT05859.1 hypothetical protein COLE_07179 [Cutaneotrichosporon oleaginosum]
MGFRESRADAAAPPDRGRDVWRMASGVIEESAVEEETETARRTQETRRAAAASRRGLQESLCSVFGESVLGFGESVAIALRAWRLAGLTELALARTRSHSLALARTRTAAADAVRSTPRLVGWRGWRGCTMGVVAARYDLRAASLQRLLTASAQQLAAIAGSYHHTQ